MATESTEQIVREAPEIEAYKLGLMKSAQALAAPTLPSYQVAGMSPQQMAAIQQGQAGIGAYLPFMQSGANALGASMGTMGEAADVMRGADTRGQFAAAQEAMNQAVTPAQAMGNYANLAGAGIGNLGAAQEAYGAAQLMGLGSSQADLARSQQMQMQSAGAAQRAAAQPGFMQGQSGIGQGIGALQGAAQMYNPASVQDYMNPYQQEVMQQALQEINRQGDIARQNVQAQATRAGAFGGAREGVQRAELERNLSQTRNQAITSALQQGYNTAQQQAQAAFEAQQGRQMAQGQNLTAAGTAAGNLASQQGQLGLAAAQQLGTAGQNIGAQNIQQAGLGQSAANLIGSLGSQQAGLAGQYANIAGQQANILGNQSQQLQGLGQGIGSLAGQQYNVGQGIAQGLGSLGSQLGNLGVQQAALGQQAQTLGQNDVNFLYNLGAQQQQQQQAVLDAQRATALQSAYQPYQQLAFMSDIYKGAPSTQMAVTSASQASPSPFQQITGAGVGILGTAAAANSLSKTTGGSLF